VAVSAWPTLSGGGPQLSARRHLGHGGDRGEVSLHPGDLVRGDDCQRAVQSAGKAALAQTSIADNRRVVQVYVNGTHFCSFAHRASPDDIKGLKIHGEVELHGVHVK